MCHFKPFIFSCGHHTLKPTFACKYAPCCTAHFKMPRQINTSCDACWSLVPAFVPAAPGTKEQALGEATSESADAATDTASSNDTRSSQDASTNRSQEDFDRVTTNSEEEGGMTKEYVGYGLTMRFPQV